MNFLNYCTPYDIACSLYFKKRFWFHGVPKVELEGEEGTFGQLKFDFGDEVIVQNVYVKDRNKILDAACLAVTNFQELTDKMHEDPSYKQTVKSRGSQAWL